ncbi:MAG: sulfatase [Planctomycetota bacterium]|nr:MAG: sulfatase [Planctomycetota bacterium]
MSSFNCNRRDFLKRSGLCAAGVLVGGCAGAARQASRGAGKPNIIIILADDLGYGDIGCYGNKTINTPNIDALAEGGLKFTDFHSNSPVCSPTRAAFLTGRYQQRCGVEGVVTAKGHRDKGMPLAETTFAEVLKEAGYRTAMFGKWHVGYHVRFNPVKQGFDEFVGYVSGNVDYISHIDQVGYKDWWKNTDEIDEEGYTTDLITKHGMDFIERNKSKPFCLYLAHEAPHYPYQGRGDKPVRVPGAPKAFGGRKDKAVAYKEMVEIMDEGIGRVVETVKRLGLERKTFIFFFSDNGATRLGSNAPLRGFKGGIFEGGHRIPAVAYWPGKIRGGTITDQTAIGMDLFATMASVAGAPIPKGLKLDGVDLSPVLFKRKKLGERTLFWRYKNQRCVRRGPWKLVVAPANKKNAAAAVSLFNLDDDLAEANDLASVKPEITKELVEALAEWENYVAAGVERQS